LYLFWLVCLVDILLILKKFININFKTE
jgi:hypothetical protein